MASSQNPAPEGPAKDEVTYMRPVSNCSGCGDTKVSWSVHEGMRRFNRELGLKGKDRYELIYAADRGCGNLQGFHAYGIVGRRAHSFKGCFPAGKFEILAN